jgi:hypothetical protein
MIPFTRESFLEVFQAYNEAVWPAEIVLVALAVAAVASALRGTSRSSAIAGAVLVALWFWMAIVYHWTFFARLTAAALLFGLVFVGQAALLGRALLDGRLRFGARRGPAKVIGLATIVYALLVYPLIAALSDHSYPRSPSFGLPCPTTIFTFGMLLLAARPVPKSLLFIPVAWAAVGSAAALQLGIWEDLGLPIAAIVVVIARMRERGLPLALTLSAAACVSGDANDGSSSTTSDGTSETTGGCGELPLCDLCPAEMATLCGSPCPQGAAPCSNTIGDGMSCEAGVWSCVVHPPLGLDCNEVCELTVACSEVGCSSGFTLALEAAGDALPVGTYELDSQIDGAADSCSFTISDDPIACAIPPCVTDTTCNALYLLQESPQHVDLAFGVVAALDVTLTRDAIEVAHESFTPAYGTFAPNGRGCEPVCAQASAVITIP